MNEKHKLAKECLFAFSRSVHQRILYLQDVVLQDCLTDDQMRILKKIELQHLSSFTLRDQGRKQEVMKGLMRTITALRAADIAADRAANELEDHFNRLCAQPTNVEDNEIFKQEYSAEEDNLAQAIFDEYEASASAKIAESFLTECRATSPPIEGVLCHCEYAQGHTGPHKCSAHSCEWPST